MKRILVLLAIFFGVSARASGVAALGDIACGIYVNTATNGISYVENEWLDAILNVEWGTHTPTWWTDYGVTIPNASVAPDAAATTGQLKWCIHQTSELLDNVATNVGGAGYWLSSVAADLPAGGNDEAVTVAGFAALVEPVVRRVQQLEIDSMYPALEHSSIDNLFDYGCHSNELVSIAHLKQIFCFDPNIDSYTDGIPDWWQRYYGLITWGDYGYADPAADFDWDGSTDYEEWRKGTDPTDRDEDGDGLLDGVDPDPRSWTDGADADHDGIPDALEWHWFGCTNSPHSSSDLGWGCFSFGQALAFGICPTNPAPETTYPSNGLSSLMILPRFGVVTNGGQVVWSSTFYVPRHASWEQFFLSSSPDPREDADHGTWSLDGFVLEWYGEDGSTVSASASPSYASQFIYVPPEEYQQGFSEFQLTLRATGNGLAVCPQPIYLVSYTPAVEFPGLPSAVAGDTVLSASASGDDIAFSIDWSTKPGDVEAPSDGSDETLFEDLGADSVSFVRNADGLVTGGTLHGVHAGVYGIPIVAPPEEPPLRNSVSPSSPLRRYLLAILDPCLTFGTGHGPDSAGLTWDGSSYSRTHDYPLDDYTLWRSFYSDATGGFVCNCTPKLEIGISDEYIPYFTTNIVVTTDSGGRETATATVKLSGSTVWTGAADHDRFSVGSVEAISSDASCDCAGGEVDGHSAGSVRFRLSLGEPRAGQYSGFVWFRFEKGFLVSQSSFELLARSDAAVSDATAGGVRTIVCSDARGRTVAISPIQNGVLVSVTTTATGAPDHSWTIVNENGSASRIRFVRTSRAGNIQSDATYVLADGVWSVSNNVAGTTETLVRTDELDDLVCPTSSVERVLRDAAGLALSHTFVSSRRYGEGASAVLRETERREDIGTPFEKASFATYWEGGGKRFGLPRLVSGNDRAWSWTDYDAKGRPILVFDQRDGAPCPDDGTGWTLASHPASLKAFATVRSYAPVPNAGDSDHPDDDATPRTTSRYVVDGASSTLISRTWTVVTHGTTAGRPSVAVRTERAASQSAQFGDSGNAVSVSVSVDSEAPGVPLLLRGRPLSYTDEDGVTTTYEYAFGTWNEAAKVFAASSGASHLRTRVLSTTPEASAGVPLVSTVSETVEDAVHGNEVWSATRVLLANGSLSDPFDWEARTYDDQNRLRSTLYSDGSSSTNAYSCCRLLFTVGRDGRKVLRSAQTGTDHLYYATEEVSLAELPHYTNSTPYSGWTAADYRVTQHFMDALGRETESVTRIGRSPGQATNAVFSSSGAWTTSEETLYDYGVSDFAVRVDANCNCFVSGRTGTETNSASWSETGYGWIPGVADYHKKDIRTSYRGGGSVSLREEGTNWVRTTSLSFYGSDGRRTDVSVTETSDGECVTNSVSVSDFLGRIARVVTPLSDATYAYDGASSRAVSVADSVSGLSTATIYDALREPVGSVSAGVSSLSNTRYELSSNAWWRVTETREATGAQTNLLSTVRERLTGLSDSLRSEMLSIDESGVATHAVSSFDPATKILTETISSPVASTVVRKSMFGREIERTEYGETVRTFYDSFGRVFATRRAGGSGSGAYDRLEALYARNALGYVADETRGISASDAAVTERYYDSVGHVYREYDATGHDHEFAYDLSDRVTEDSGDAVYPTKQSYDALGRRISLSTTRNGMNWDTTHWGYDAATGLCTNKTYADGSRVAHTFAPDGLPLRTTFASGRWTQNAYDASRRVSSVSTSDGEGNVSYLYDAFGRVTRATGYSARYDYARDSLGRVTSEVRRTGGFRPTIVSTVSRDYDAYGRPAGYGLSFYGDFKQGVCYTWGMDGKLESMVVSNAQGRAVEIAFDWNRGRGVGWGVSGLSSPWASFSQFFRRDAWRPWLVDRASAGAGFHGDSRTLQYSFDRLGRPVSRSGDAFAYNPRGEVTNAVLDSAVYRYAYDEIGNRESAYEAGTTTAYAANELNQYTEVGSDEPEYDEDGNLVDDGTRAYDWSAAGHLNEAAGPSVRLAFEYDHLGRRVSRVVETRFGNSWHISEERFFAYDGWNLVHETRFDSSGAETDVEYFWGPDLSGTLQGAGGVGGLVAVSVDGDYYFPGYDNNGNVIGYWNEDGEIVAEYAYDAFGNTIYEDGDMADFFPHRFSTKYYDAETDLYYYGYRYYSPSLGRWISRDPIEEEGGMNLVAFCINNPLSGVDAFGSRVMVISASSDSALSEPNSPDSIVSNAIQSGVSRLRKFHDDVKSTTDDKFDELKRCGRVKFNGVEFAGTKQEYLDLISWEMSSFHKTLHGDGVPIQELQANFRNAVMVLAKDYDWLIFVAHGSVFDPRKLKLADSYENRNWLEDQVASAIRPSFQGKVLFVSCFQDWTPKKNLEDLTSDFSVGMRIPPTSQKYKNEWYRFEFRSFVPYLQIGSGNLHPID